MRRSITSCPASTSTRATTSGTLLSSRKRTQLLRRLSQLPRDQQIDFATMIFVIGEAFVNLRASNIGKTVRDGIDCFAVLQKADHVVNTDACSFDPRVTAANSAAGASVHRWKPRSPVREQQGYRRWHCLSKTAVGDAARCKNARGHWHDAVRRRAAGTKGALWRSRRKRVACARPLVVEWPPQAGYPLDDAPCATRAQSHSGSP